jgi:hypothetical protein
MAAEATLTATCNRVQSASCAVSAAATLTCVGRKKWEDDPDTAESWTPIADTAESWSAASDTVVAWTPASDTAETWTPASDTARTWTEKTHPAYLQAA